MASTLSSQPTITSVSAESRPLTGEMTNIPIMGRATELMIGDKPLYEYILNRDEISKSSVYIGGSQDLEDFENILGILHRVILRTPKPLESLANLRSDVATVLMMECTHVFLKSVVYAQHKNFGINSSALIEKIKASMEFHRSNRLEYEIVVANHTLVGFQEPKTSAFATVTPSLSSSTLKPEDEMDKLARQREAIRCQSTALRKLDDKRQWNVVFS